MPGLQIDLENYLIIAEEINKLQKLIRLWLSSFLLVKSNVIQTLN